MKLHVEAFFFVNRTSSLRTHTQGYKKDTWYQIRKPLFPQKASVRSDDCTLLFAHLLVVVVVVATDADPSS